MGMVIGLALKKRLKKTGVSMRDLSRKSGIPYGTLSAYLNGYINPSAEKMTAVESAIEEIESTPTDLRQPADGCKKCEPENGLKTRLALCGCAVIDLCRDIGVPYSTMSSYLRGYSPMPQSVRLLAEDILHRREATLAAGVRDMGNDHYRQDALIEDHDTDTDDAYNSVIGDGEDEGTGGEEIEIF